MATVLVAGRVEEDVAHRAEALIKQAGFTNSEVIRAVWQNIADTGDLPRPVADQCKRSAYSRLLSLQAATPQTGMLADLSPEGERELLGERVL